MTYISPFFRTTLFSLAIASGAHSQIASKPVPPLVVSPKLRTLIVSGGPSADYTQYAIESNARYVEKLTSNGQQRVLFADGNRKSRTISTIEQSSNSSREATVLSWILYDAFSGSTVMKAPTLKRLDGASTPGSITREVKKLALTVKDGEHALVYFTGHGSEGQKFGFFGGADYDNTLYSGWNDDLSMRQMAPSLQNWPQNVPVTLVMVQCYSGGFANLIWKGGNIKNGVWPRDFCGFFAATGDRMASGCTSEVNERDYQDFTTHFFAALSGISRDGRVITGADFDGNGTVSGLEAFAYTNLHDDSIDVPMCTSDMYLRGIYGQPNAKQIDSWTKTPYSQVLTDATDWQKAILNGMSSQLKLTGENRIKAAFDTHKKLTSGLDVGGRHGNDRPPTQKEEADFEKSFESLKSEVLQRFPALKTRGSRNYAASKTKALAFLKTQPKAVDAVYKATRAYMYGSESDETREAKLSRFLRTTYTVLLQKRLSEQGTVDQKSVFSRIRTSEERNFLKQDSFFDNK